MTTENDSFGASECGNQGIIQTGTAAVRNFDKMLYNFISNCMQINPQD